MWWPEQEWEWSPVVRRPINDSEWDLQSGHPEIDQLCGHSAPTSAPKELPPCWVVWIVWWWWGGGSSWPGVGEKYCQNGSTFDIIWPTYQFISIRHPLLMDQSIDYWHWLFDFADIAMDVMMSKLSRLSPGVAEGVPGSVQTPSSRWAASPCAKLHCIWSVW